MKNLNKFINESLKPINNSEVTKVGDFIDDDNKRISFIKNNKSKFIKVQPTDSNIQDISDAIEDCHRPIAYYDEMQNEENFSKYIDSENKSLYDKYDPEIVDTALRLYKMIFKKITNKI